MRPQHPAMYSGTARNSALPVQETARATARPVPVPDQASVAR